MKQIASILLLCLLLFIFVACSMGTTSDISEMEEIEMTHDDSEKSLMEHGDGLINALEDGFKVIDAFGRAVPSVSETSAFYMVINNGTDTDEILESVDIDICRNVELHEMSMDGDVMMMQEVDDRQIRIPAGKAVTLQPGGKHVMCIGKEGELAVGDMISLILNFQNAGTVEVDAEIREIN